MIRRLIDLLLAKTSEHCLDLELQSDASAFH